jgi:ABC-2 type transport system permease protein/oleandomycin transport system permease protein
MTAVSTTPTRGPATFRPVTPLVALRDTIAIAKRNLLKVWRTPQLLVFVTIQPVMFVLLFRYVFGGAIHVKGGNYVNYLMAGIFVQTSLFGGASTAVGLAEDLKSGIIDRFRSLPMARSAVLAGRTLADLTRSLLVVAVMILVGVLVGFRFHGSVLEDVAAIALVLLFGYTFSWVFAAIGLAVKDPETAQVAGFIPLFPFIFASSAFVPVSSMPGWLQAFANVQPVSVTITAVRDMLEGGPVFHYLWQSLFWTAGILLVAVPLAVSTYRRS